MSCCVLSMLQLDLQPLRLTGIDGSCLATMFRKVPNTEADSVLVRMKYASSRPAFPLFRAQHRAPCGNQLCSESSTTPAIRKAAPFRLARTRCLVLKFPEVGMIHEHDAGRT